MHLMHKASLVLALLAIVGIAAAPAHAQNLVVNGGFENGDLTGWATNGSVSAAPATSVYVPHSGQYDAGFGGSFGSISENINLVSGQTYDLVFYAAALGPNDFSVRWNAQVIPGSPSSIPLNGTNTPADYTRFEFDGLTLASTNNATLQFTAAGGGYSVLLDDISVTAANPVPETSSALSLGLLLLLGAGGFAVSRRRKAGAAR